MAKNSVRDFDATAANNTDIQSVNIAEGCAPSGINNAIRELMADMKDVSAGTIALESPQADSLTVTGNLTVDTSTLKVDSTNNRVGILETSPTVPLEVKGAQGYASSASNLSTSTTKAAAKIRGSNDASAALFFGSLTNDAEQYIQSCNGAGTAADDLALNPFGGTVLVGKVTPDFDGGVFEAGPGGTFVSRSGTPMNVNRNGSDGKLIGFSVDGSEKGDISVSGTTVSFNGGHLSRWSQLTDGTKDTSIVKGTVMTNLDKMAVWSHDAVAATYYVDGDELPELASVGDEKTPAKDAYTEDNEQLNCMAVSSVEGDTNVAGVFVNWDNDDDQFNDMNVAMTGDMVIRIAKGTTVARGDLLMSAGDGTAKPQDDDIVRSKTIAKVTSTNVSHTYDDGSYLVPCVLMAC
jgi:hypothetical protein